MNDLSDSERLINCQTLENLNQKNKLEGALGYAHRIADLLNSKKTLDEIHKIITDDAQSISGALSDLYITELENAGAGYGLFKEHNTQ